MKNDSSQWPVFPMMFIYLFYQGALMLHLVKCCPAIWSNRHCCLLFSVLSNSSCYHLELIELAGFCDDGEFRQKLKQFAFWILMAEYGSECFSLVLHTYLLDLCNLEDGIFLDPLSPVNLIFHHHLWLHAVGLQSFSLYYCRGITQFYGFSG